MPIFVRDRTYSKSAPVREANCSIWHALRLLHWHSSPTTSISTNWFERPWWMTTSYFSRDPSIGYTVLEGSMPLSVCISSNTWSIPGRLCYGSLNILLRGESCIWRRPIWAHPHGSCSETTGPKSSLSFPRHFHLFSRAKIADLFTGCGLQIVSHHSVVEASAWTVSIRNRLGMDFSVRKKGILGVIDYRNVIARTFFSAVDLVSMWCGFSTSTQALIARKPAGAG